MVMRLASPSKSPVYENEIRMVITYSSLSHSDLVRYKSKENVAMKGWYKYQGGWGVERGTTTVAQIILNILAMCPKRRKLMVNQIPLALHRRAMPC